MCARFQDQSSLAAKGPSMLSMPRVLALISLTSVRWTVTSGPMARANARVVASSCSRVPACIAYLGAIPAKWSCEHSPFRCPGQRADGDPRQRQLGGGAHTFSGAGAARPPAPNVLPDDEQ